MNDSAAVIRQADPGLFLIALNQPGLAGFTDFIGAWMITGPPPILVDVGPAASVPTLVQALAGLGVRHLDAILLTHIHIDHAGGAGDLCRHFPDAPVVCHPSSHRHLADPTKLWQGSLDTLGDTARAYGPIAPVPPDRLVDAQGFGQWGITLIPTPGHAPHHISFRIGEWLFAGEAGGVFQDCGKTIYLRPATPPRFFLETSLESLDRLRSVPHGRICYGHFGSSTDGPRLMAAHRRQLLDWHAIIEDECKVEGGDPELADRCLQRLLATDPLLAPYAHFPAAVRRRERGFLANSIRGFVGYIAQHPSATAATRAGKATALGR